MPNIIKVGEHEVSQRDSRGVRVEVRGLCEREPWAEVAVYEGMIVVTSGNARFEVKKTTC